MAQDADDGILLSDDEHTIDPRDAYLDPWVDSGVPSESLNVSATSSSSAVRGQPSVQSLLSLPDSHADILLLRSVSGHFNRFFSKELKRSRHRIKRNILGLCERMSLLKPKPHMLIPLTYWIEDCILIERDWGQRIVYDQVFMWLSKLAADLLEESPA